MGHEPLTSGIVTRLLKKTDNRKPIDPEVQGMVDGFQPMNDIADAQGWPSIWVICPHCGQYGWRLPPHLFDPCPLVVEAAETQGLKMDTERMAVLRNATALEAQLQAFQQYIQGLGGDDE